MTEFQPEPAAAPIFILSFRQRDELAAAIANAGWRTVAARRADGAERRLVAAGAAVAVVDARGAIEDGLVAARMLGPVAASQGGALLTLISRGDAGRIGEFYDAGATHFLASPMRQTELIQAVRFAERYVARVTGGWERRAGPVLETLGWRYDPASRSLQVTPALARVLNLPKNPEPRAFLRGFAPIDRRLAQGAIRRLADMPSTAFAHDVPGVGRVVQHLQRDARTGRIHALVEPLGVPDAGAAMRDALAGTRDVAGARRWLERRLGEGAGVFAIAISVTGIEAVNAAYGRDGGDTLLRAVERRIAEAMRDTLGRSILVARLGGPDFLVAVEADMAKRDIVTQAAERIADALARPFVAGERIAPLSAHVVSLWSEQDDTADNMLRKVVDTLAERRQPDGKGELSLDRLAVDLRRALEGEEEQIEVRFQPQVATATGIIIGVEALARWRHPALGELGAETLFAAGDRAGLDIALSDHVQQRALAIAAGWPESLGKLRLSINITAADVARPNFTNLLLARIDDSGFPRGRLTVEVTESGLIEELGEAGRLLSELRLAGCRVAIDDFGTGYSSLAYLKALPLDYLKIDKKLSQDITGSVRDRVVVRGVIDMARSLGLSVVAEGVETTEQLDLLAKEGCQYYQGYLCAEPLELDALTALVEGR